MEGLRTNHRRCLHPSRDGVARTRASVHVPGVKNSPFVPPRSHRRFSGPCHPSPIPGLERGNMPTGVATLDHNTNAPQQPPLPTVPRCCITPTAVNSRRHQSVSDSWHERRSAPPFMLHHDWFPIQAHRPNHRPIDRDRLRSHRLGVVGQVILSREGSRRRVPSSRDDRHAKCWAGPRGGNSEGSSRVPALADEATRPMDHDEKNLTIGPRRHYMAVARGDPIAH